MLLAEVADQASQAAPLPAGDRLRMAARGRTVGAEASSYQALEVPEDRAQAENSSTCVISGSNGSVHL